MDKKEYKRKYYQANKEKIREYRRKQYAANPEANRQKCMEWRAANPDLYKSYQAKYWKKYLDDPVKNLCHAARYHINNNKEKYNKEKGMTTDHILPVLKIVKFFDSCGYLPVANRSEEKMQLINIINSEYNIRYIPAKENTKRKHADLETQLLVARNLESDYSLCEGLVEFVEELPC